jgi:hypothetical protein
MEFDAVGDTNSAPGGRGVVVLGGDDVGSGDEGRLEGASDASFEGIAGDALHFGFDGLERLAFALADFYREELEQVPVIVRCGGACSFGAVDESSRDVEANGAGAWGGAGARVGRA